MKKRGPLDVRKGGRSELEKGAATGPPPEKVSEEISEQTAKPLHFSTDSEPEKGSLPWFVSKLRSGVDERTIVVIASVMRKYRHPEAAPHAALEALELRRAKPGPALAERGPLLRQDARQSRRGRPVRGMTQRDRVLELLADGRWHNGAELLENGVWRYTARVDELRLSGHLIESRRAARSPLAEYRLIPAVPTPMPKPALAELAPRDVDELQVDELTGEAAA